jgi:aspartyl-tRNA(Asn)/glutamyl-tRNA(Gln) amidotransferase subunit C
MTMSLDPAAIRRIAKLARIRVADDALPRLAGDLNAILGWIEQLNEVDIEGVTPLTGAAQMTLAWRADVVNDGGDAERALSNAPDREGQFYAVPKVVE